MAVSAIQGVVISALKAEMESISPDQASWIRDWEAKKWAEVDENGVSKSDSRVYHKWYGQTTGWSTWVSTGQECYVTPVAINYGPTMEDVAVFGTGWDGLPWAGIATSDSTFSFKKIGDRVKRIRDSSISACAYDGRISLIAVERATSQIVYTWYQNDVWATSWTSFGGSFICCSKPVIVSCKPSRLDVIAFSENYNLMRLVYRGGSAGPAGNGWENWQNCSGSYMYNPSAMSISPGRIDIFGIGSDAQIYQSTITITGNEIGTVARTCIGGTSISSPKTQLISPGVFSVITRKSKGVFQQKYLNASTGVWTPSGGMTEIVPPAV
ncbi:hypothetical protein EAF00_003574 [Botryotinia globosa]|nr:hypothetical protein EAF00_003574 [Botryotinia globosa]